MSVSGIKRPHAASPTPSSVSFTSKKRRYDGPPPAAVNTLAKHLAGQVNQVVEWLKVGKHRCKSPWQGIGYRAERIHFL
jgi:hypothetical protein